MKEFIKGLIPLAATLIYLGLAMSFVAYKHYWMIPICLVGCFCSLWSHHQK